MTPNTSASHSAPELRRAAALAALFATPGLLGTLHAADATPSNAKEKTAQDNAGTTKLDDVVVLGQATRELSSPKFTSPLLNTPQTVVVIPSSLYQEQAATSLRDVLRNTPGITFQAGEGGNATGDNLFIRGFGARNDVYTDGVRDAGVLTRDTFNTEQVEVSKGPSSAISGRGSTGGSINQVTKTPHLGRSTLVNATFGTADYGRVTLDANQELSASPIAGTAVRFNAVWTDAGVDGRDAVKNRNWGIAPSIAFGLGKPTTVTLAYAHMSQDNIPDYGLPGTLPALAVAAGHTINDLNWDNFYGLVVRDHERVDSDAATAVVEHKFSPDTVLRNLTRYSRNKRDGIVTPPRAASNTANGGAADPGFDATQAQVRRTDTKYQDRADEIVSNLTNLTTRVAAGTVTHAIAAGVEVSRENQKNYSKTDRYTNGRPPVTSLYTPNPNDPYDPSGIERTGAHTDAIADTGALYAFDTLEIGERWEFTAGGRWELIDTAYKSVSAAGVVTRYQRTDDMLSWRTGLVFKPVAYGSLYAGYGTSFNPSIDGAQGITLGATGGNSAGLDPEENRSTEFGTKWNLFEGRLALTAALFRTEKTNAKTTDSLGHTVLAGNQRVEGVELGVSGRITDAWNVFGGYAYMDSSIRASGVAAQVDAALQYVPKQTFNLWTTYQLPIKLVVGGGLQFMDGYFYALPTATNTPNQGLGTKYTLYSAMASYDFTPRFGLRLNVSNLTDKRYIDRGYNGHVIPGPGRSVLLTASLKF